MTPLFADTFYYLALLNVLDGAHEKAVVLTKSLSSPVITTEFVLLEVADALCGPDERKATASFLQEMVDDRETEVIPCSHELFVAGTKLYQERADKAWSLTDCISFEAMRERGISDALTHDHHFKQAGFRILL